MQISFSHEHVYTPEWRGNVKLPEGERFTVTLKVMNVENLMFLLDAFSEAGIEGDVELDELKTDQLKPIIKTVGHLLPIYASINNLKNSDTGTDIVIADVVEYPYFLNLAAELLMRLAEVSTPNDDDVGNSNAPLDSEATPQVLGSFAK